MSATSTCALCLRAHCGPCLVFERGRELCVRCVLAEREAHAVRKRYLLMVGVVGVVALGAVLFGRPWEGTARSRGPIGVRQARLRAEPCDRLNALKLGEELVRAGEAREALALVQEFEGRCGSYAQLDRVAYAAHSQLSEHRAAVDSVTRLLESEPLNKDYWYWRGAAYEQLGEVEHAISDYEQAMAVQKGLKPVPLSLVALYERAKRPCDALSALDRYLMQHPELRALPKYQQRLLRLRRRATCDDLAGEGSAVIRLQQVDRMLVVVARVNGAEEGRFVVDTGATYVTLSRRFVGRLKLNLSDAELEPMTTAGGVRMVQRTVLDSVELDGATARKVETAVSDELPVDVDGLLGLSFFSRFALKLDVETKTMELSARARP